MPEKAPTPFGALLGRLPRQTEDASLEDDKVVGVLTRLLTCDVVLVAQDDVVEELDCLELDDRETWLQRSRMWEDAVAANGGIHPDAPSVDSRVLKRIRATASPALRGAGVTND